MRTQALSRTSPRRFGASSMSAILLHCVASITYARTHVLYCIACDMHCITVGCARRLSSLNGCQRHPLSSLRHHSDPLPHRLPTNQPREPLSLRGLLCVTRWPHRPDLVLLPCSSSTSLLVGSFHALPTRALVFALFTALIPVNSGLAL